MTGTDAAKKVFHRGGEMSSQVLDGMKSRLSRRVPRQKPRLERIESAFDELGTIIFSRKGLVALGALGLAALIFKPKNN